jgi:hypothetical protein
MINLTKFSRQVVTFVLTVFVCIYSGNIASLAATTSQFIIQEYNSPHPTKIAAIPSSDCEEIGDNEEKKDLLAKKIVRYMESKRYEISRGRGQRNIVYIEGACSDGTANADEADVYNDRRIVFEFTDGEPKILGNWLATTEPGTYFTEHPLNPRGAARISFGQYKRAWKVGRHEGPSGRGAHEGLVQAGAITFTRDLNKDGKRTGDREYTENPSLNQHRGGGSSNKTIGRQSAGCLVGWSPEGHTEFMNIVKNDTRYQNNSNYKFTTAVLNGDRFAEAS